MPIYETGHARNIQRFQEMISFVTSWGAAYAPSNPAISLVSLNAKLTASDTAMNGVTASLMDSKTAINERENEYSGLRKLVTRVVNYYESTGVPQNQIDDARTLKRKIDGTRAKAVEDDPATPEDESQNSISASQQSYTQLAEHFDALIQLVGADSNYAPNEADLDIPALQAKEGSMQSGNLSVINSYTTLSNARGTRDNALYAENTGLVDIALLVKKYAKAAFGTDSTQYEQVSSLPFSRPN